MVWARPTPAHRLRFRLGQQNEWKKPANLGPSAGGRATHTPLCLLRTHPLPPLLLFWERLLPRGATRVALAGRQLRASQQTEPGPRAPIHGTALAPALARPPAAF